MYEYRKLSLADRKDLVEERLKKGYPPHSPPHPIRDHNYYLLTAACYQHAPFMKSPNRRQELLDAVFETFIEAGIAIHAWVILLNHYHLLVYVDDFAILGNLFRLIHGRFAYKWNNEDKTPARKVWYRYADRAIRSERHYFTTLNIHYNPVKHGLVKSPYDWKESSVHWYLAENGRDWLRDMWQAYPIRDYGKKWDESL